MKTNLEDSAYRTRQPDLTFAVLAQLGLDINDEDSASTLSDIASHSADAGWSGFTYYSDTTAFFQANKADILARLKEDAAEFGLDPFAMVAGFGCLKDEKFSSFDVAEAICSPDGDENTRTLVQNALAWYALEDIARELCPDV